MKWGKFKVGDKIKVLCTSEWYESIESYGSIIGEIVDDKKFCSDGYYLVKFPDGKRWILFLYEFEPVEWLNEKLWII